MKKENDAQKLYGLGWSKYAIAKRVKVSWNTVHFWVRGIYEPELKHRIKLNDLLLLTRDDREK